MTKSLYAQYYDAISAWDWARLHREALNNPYAGWDSAINDEHDMGSAYLGSSLNLSPSGKYYTPFANSNVTTREAYRDEQWFAALEQVAVEHHGWIECGEGDPTDLYFVIQLT